MYLITKFEGKVDFQNHLFGWLRFGIFFKKIIEQQRQKMELKFYSKLIKCLGTGWENKN